jgi:hypothetical protein
MKFHGGKKGIFTTRTKEEERGCFGILPRPGLKLTHKESKDERCGTNKKHGGAAAIEEAEMALMCLLSPELQLNLRNYSTKVCVVGMYPVDTTAENTIVHAVNDFDLVLTQ